LGSQAMPQQWPPPDDWLLETLRVILGLRIGIEDTDTVARTLVRLTAQPPSEAAEDIIAALRPDVVEIRLSHDDLRRLTSDDPHNERKLFSSPRERLFNNLGVICPRFHFNTAVELPSGFFAFTINHLPTLPMSSLNPDQALCLADTSHKILDLQRLEKQRTIDPVTHQPATIVQRIYSSLLRQYGLTIFEPFDFLAHCLSTILYDHRVCFLDRRFVQRQLNTLKSSFPALVATATKYISLGQLTSILRNLLREQVSIRDLRLILDLLLDDEQILTGNGIDVSQTTEIIRKRMSSGSALPVKPM